MRFLYAFIFTLIISVAAFAQATGSIAGQVVDQNGAILPGVTVTAVNSAGVEKTATTNAGGEYTITGLPAGTYTVRVNATGFGAYENTEVTVAAGRREELIVTLSVVIEQQQVEVSTDNGVNTDPENNKSALVLRGAELEQLPEDPDELAAALQALAGPSAGPNGGQFYIDGFSGGRLPPRESIREIRINQNPFSAEFDRIGFGRVEILTKPGSDKFRGQAFFNFNDESLNSRDPFARNRASSQTRFFGGNVSGPIIKNKSSFFFDIDNRDFTENAVVNATILDPSLNITAFNQAFVQPRKRFSVSPRVDYAINDRNTLVARYSFERGTVTNQGIGNVTLPSLASDSKNTEHTFQLTETSILSPTAVNETRFQFAKNRSEQIGDNSIPTISVAGAFNGGGAQVGFGFNDSSRFELQNITTWTVASRHNLKFGGRLRNIKIDNRSESNFGGSFTFSGAATGLNSIEQYRQKILDDASDPNNDNAAFLPIQFRVTAGNPLADVSQTDFGGFITDDFRFRPDLTLNFGLRYEVQSNTSDFMNFAPRLGFAYSPGAGGAKAPKTVIRGGFGVFYDRFSENFTLQSIRFNGANQFEYIVSANDPDPVRRAAAIQLLQQPVFTQGGVTNVPTAAQIATLLPSSSTIRQISDNIRSPYTIQSQIEVERQLPFGLTLTTTYLNSRGVHLLRTRNINAPVCPPGVVCPLNPLRPDPTRGNLYQYESTGFLRQNELRFRFNTRFNPRYTLFGFYRLGKTESDVDGTGFPQYSYDLDNEFSRSSFDTRHFAVIGGQFTLPYKFRLGLQAFISSGRPFNITTGVDNNRDSLFNDRPTFAQLSARCQQLNLNKPFCDVSGVSDLNQVIPRNYGEGPGSFTVNPNINRTFGFGKSRSRAAAATQNTPNAQSEAGARQPPASGGEASGRRDGQGGGGGRAGNRGGFGGGFGQGGGGGSDKPYNLTLGVQIRNLFNRNNQGQPIGNLSSPLFGASNSTSGGFGGFGGGGGGGGNAGNRRVDLQLRFSF